ncbi:MAG: FCD domain-containing protein [Planctomycetota bacterium]
MSDAIAEKRTIKSEMVASKIREYIIENGLKPGDRLPTEGELTELYGVSRVSVREATKALSFLGIVDAAPRRGLTVGSVSMERVSKYLAFHFAVSNYPMAELIETRVIIETGGLHKVAQRMAGDPGIYQQLNAINDQLRKARSMKDWIGGDIEFHRTLVAASGLSALSAFNDLVQVFFLKFRADFPRGQWSDGVKTHQEIIDALRDGKPDLAAELLTAHIGSHRDRLHSES